MTKDRRYKLVKDQISGGHLKSFLEIFEVVPKTVVLKDLHIHNQRFNEMLDDVSLFLFQEVYQLADLIEIDAKIIIDFVHDQYVIDRKRKNKK